MSPKTQSGGLGDPLLTIKEIAVCLQCKARTVHRLIDNDELEVIRIGRLVRVLPRR